MHARLSLEKGTAFPSHYSLRLDEQVSLGRSRGNTIIVRDKWVSKEHARIFADQGRWFIRDLQSHNGVRVNGRKVEVEAELPASSEVVLGEVHFRFTVEGGKDSGDDHAAPVVQAPTTPPDDFQEDETVLQHDELTALYGFLSDSLDLSDPHRLVRLALGTMLRQVQADLVGFRSLEADDLLIVLPERAQVDACLSNRLTDKALAEGATVWMADPANADLNGESLAGMRDGLCVPLLQHTRGPGEQKEPPLGALHGYHRNRSFSQEEVRFCQVLAGCLAGCLRGVHDRRALEADNSRLRLGSPGGDDALIGDSPAIHRLRDQINRLADHRGSVLITGETGVGKELVALGLHRASQRHGGPLVTVNCGSLNPSTAAAEFFGHASRAFTGAEDAHPGFFQQADGGTLFLDEIGELSLEMQVMLLRVLETRSFRPMKAVSDLKVDVRVLAATNRNLGREVKARRFREDLFFRFSVSIETPPLRDHAEDVPALARHFLAHVRTNDGRPLSLTDAALQRLRTYAWPGNVRQLRYLLEGTAAQSRDGRIDAADLHLLEGGVDSGSSLPLNLEALEAWAIGKALEQTGGHQARAAEVLGIHRETLNNKMRKYKIDPPKGGPG